MIAPAADNSFALVPVAAHAVAVPDGGPRAMFEAAARHLTRAHAGAKKSVGSPTERDS